MKPVGCDDCRNTGYAGRMGIFEMFIIDDEVRHMINNRQSTLDPAQARARDRACARCARTASARCSPASTSAEEVISITLGDAN